MPDKKIIDDYYSQINSSNDWEKSSEENSKKPKIIPKKKIVVKKPAAKDATGISGEKKSEKKPLKNTRVKKVADGETASEDQKQKKPRIVQKIEVIKKPEKRNITVVKKEDQEPKVKTRNSFNKNNGNDFRNEVPSVNLNKDTGKVFTKNKPKGWFKTKFEEESAKKWPKSKFNKKTRWKVRLWNDENPVFTRSNKLQKNKKEEKNVESINQNLVEKRWATVTIPEFLSLKELSEKFWVVLPKLIAEFMKNWLMVTINSKIDFDTAAIIWESFDIKVERWDNEWVSVEDILVWNISSFLAEDDASKLSPRAPVVSIMGHVDHWKTSLLDYIRKAKIASGEAGWITQSIWAYQVELDQWNITFLDTPWHEAFTVMRARWAKSTDIAILVVAADEWVKPQTIESISHAKEAWIPVIVAINKMDKVGANPDHVKWQLAENWLMAEDWGGDIPMIPVSAHSWFWVDELLEMILLVAEMKELKANPDRNWVATILESHLDPNLWPVATVLINTWTINSWDNIVCQDSYWKVKILKNYINQKVKFAKPWEPVLIVGLDRVVDGWDILQVVNSWEIAKNKSIEYRELLNKQNKESGSSLDLLMSKIRAWNLKQLKIILKADTNGSLEAIKASLVKLSTEETTVTIIHSWVGSITEWDALMGQWSDAILVWFNVWVLPTAKSSLESSWVEFISSDIIYHITEKIEKIVTWMLDPKEVEVVLGKMKVWGIFFTEKKFMILGLHVWPEEKVENKAKVRIFRKKKFVGNWVIDSLKQWTLEVKEVEGPLDCWIKLTTNTKVEVWDQLEVYKTEYQK